MIIYVWQLSWFSLDSSSVASQKPEKNKSCSEMVCFPSCIHFASFCCLVLELLTILKVKEAWVHLQPFLMELFILHTTRQIRKGEGGKASNSFSVSLNNDYIVFPLSVLKSVAMKRSSNCFWRWSVEEKKNQALWKYAKSDQRGLRFIW